MGDQEKKGSLAVVAEQLAKPVYRDVGQGAAREVGKSLAVVGSFVRLAVRPMQSFALAGHLAFDWLDDALRKKFEGVPEEKIVEPPANVAGPLMLAAGFTSEGQPELRELYAHLLATAMNSDTKSKVHPAFVEVIKQLTPAEAVLLKALAVDRTHPAVMLGTKRDGMRLKTWVVFTALTPDGLDVEGWEIEVIGLQNLRRMGVVELDFEQSFADEARYDSIRAGNALKELIKAVRLSNPEVPCTEILGMVNVTDFGFLLLRACLSKP